MVGSLLVVSGRWSACGWSVVQLDHDEEWDGRDAELEVQRTIKRAELTTFLCILRKAIGPTIVHVDDKWVIDGLWRGDEKCIGRKAKDADLWIPIWEELNNFRAKESTLRRIVPRKAANVALRKVHH